jgi:hypothetical protein
MMLALSLGSHQLTSCQRYNARLEAGGLRVLVEAESVWGTWGRRLGSRKGCSQNEQQHNIGRGTTKGTFEARGEK